MSKEFWLDLVGLFLSKNGFSLNLIQGRIKDVWLYIFYFNVGWGKTLNIDLKVLTIEWITAYDTYYSYHGLLAIENSRLKSILFFNLPHKD